MHSVFKPHIELKNFVVFFCEIHWTAKNATDVIDNFCLPTGCSFMGFHSKGNIKVVVDDVIIYPPQFYINQQTTKPYRMQSDDKDLQLTIACLRPTALYHLFQIKESTIIDRSVDSSGFFGEGFKHFQPVFKKAQSPENRVALVESLFLSQLQKAKPNTNAVDSAVHMIMESEGKIQINEITTKLNISSRYFQKLFKRMVGLTPSQYRKIIRFLNLISTLDTVSASDCKTLGAISNFYDSAHFSKEFKKFIGTNPSSFHIDDFPFLKYSTLQNQLWTQPFLNS